MVVTVLLLNGCGRARAPERLAADSAGAAADTASAVATPREPAVTNRPKSIDEVLAAHTDSLLALPGVLGTAAGRCEGAPCIRVLVGRMSEELRRRLPTELEGYRVRVDVTGPIVPR